MLRNVDSLFIMVIRTAAINKPYHRDLTRAGHTLDHHVALPVSYRCLVFDLKYLWREIIHRVHRISETECQYKCTPYHQ